MDMEMDIFSHQIPIEDKCQCMLKERMLFSFLWRNLRFLWKGQEISLSRWHILNKVGGFQWQVMSESKLDGWLETNPRHGVSRDPILRQSSIVHVESKESHSQKTKAHEGVCFTTQILLWHNTLGITKVWNLHGIKTTKRPLLGKAFMQISTYDSFMEISMTGKRTCDLLFLINTTTSSIILVHEGE